jgi:hypothetical protein
MMKRCADDCVVFCANCRHFPDLLAKSGECVVVNQVVDSLDSCDEFHCRHAHEGNADGD